MRRRRCSRITSIGTRSALGAAPSCSKPLGDWTADQRARLREFVEANPDVADYARFLAGRDAGARRARRGVARPRAVSRRSAIARHRRRPRRRRTGTRPSDRIAPPRLRGMGRRIDVRRRDECRCASRHLLRRRPGLGIPSTASGSDACERPTSVARTHRPRRTPRRHPADRSRDGRRASLVGSRPACPRTRARTCTTSAKRSSP